MFAVCHQACGERDEGASEWPIGALGGFDPSGRQNVVATGSCEIRTRQATRQHPSARQRSSEDTYTNILRSGVY